MEKAEKILLKYANTKTNDYGTFIKDVSEEGAIKAMEEYAAHCQQDAEIKLKEAIELLQYFVDRVEKGEIRSRKTYGKYKLFLKQLEQ